MEPACRKCRSEPQIPVEWMWIRHSFGEREGMGVEWMFSEWEGLVEMEVLVGLRVRMSVDMIGVGRGWAGMR